MKAIILETYGPAEALVLGELPCPQPKPGEVLLEVRAVAINDWDWCMVRGTPFYIRLLCGLVKPKIRIPGVDVAGTVQAVGSGITRFNPGDKVFGDLSESGFGAFAENVCAKESALTPMPAGMSFTDAAALPHAALLAIQALRDIASARAGQTLLINGAGGGVGTLGLQYAKSLGLQVAGVDAPDKLDTMRSIGFDHVIDYTQVDFTRAGRRYDLILDAKTNRSAFAYLRALNPGGMYVTVGGATAKILQIVTFGPLIRRFTHKDVRVLALKPNQGLDTVNGLYQAGALKPVIDGPYPFTEIPALIGLFGAGRHKGKLVVELDAAR